MGVSEMKKWYFFCVELTLKNKEKVEYISSIPAIDEREAERLARAANWISEIQSIDSIKFRQVIS